MGVLPGDYSVARYGLSLLELMVATAIMATLLTSVVAVMRTGHQVWNAQQEEIEALENGYGVLRHFVQQMRQAKEVTLISGLNDPAGNLTFIDASDSIRIWSHSGIGNLVHFDNGTGNQLLARRIDALTFIGYQADGVTQTETPEEIQAVDCTVQITLPRGGGVARTLSCRAWIRSW